MFPRIRLSDNKHLWHSKVEDTDFQVWEKNRKIDDSRVNELFKMYEKDNYQMIPGYISVFEKDKQYYIYDGQHRYEAAKKFTEEVNRNMRMDISVLEFSNPDIILKEFQGVNNSVPVPEFLLEAEVNEDKRKVCEQIVEWLSKDYREFCMKTKKPRKPNFRKDDLLDELYDSVPTNSNSNITFESIKEIIIKLNEEAKEMYSAKAVKKCEKYDFYLFYDLKFTEKLRERINNLTYFM